MIRTLAWKEYREQRGLWLAIALVAVLATLNIGLLARGGLERASHDTEIRMIMLAVLFNLIAAQGLVCGAQLFAGEKEPGTLAFLDVLSGLRRPLWRTKLLVGTLLTLGQALVLFVIIYVLQLGSWAYLLALVVVGLLTFLWGTLGGALCNTVFPAILTGIALAAANVVFMSLALMVIEYLFFGVKFASPARSDIAQAIPASPAVLIVLQIGLAVGALAVSWRRFCAPDRARGRCRERLAAAPRSKARHQWYKLVWLAARQGRWLMVPMMGLSILAGLALHRAPVLLWPLISLAIGLICGLAVFAPEQAGEQDRFLGAQRLPPGHVWLVKTLFWLLVAAALFGLVVLASLGQRDLNSVHRTESGVPGVLLSSENVGLFLAMWAVYGFCFGQYGSLLSRKIAVSGALSAGGAMLFLALWLPSLVVGGVQNWQVLAVPLVLLLATRLNVWIWFSGMLYTRRHLVGLVACCLAVAVWMGANLWHRAVEVPDVGEPFNVQAFRAELDRAAKSEAGPLMRQGVGAIVLQYQTVGVKLGPLTKPPFPLAPTDPRHSVLGYAMQQAYTDACRQILDNGWPSEDTEIARWLDAMFAAEWADQFRAAAKAPLGLLVDPRTFTWIPAALPNGKPTLRPSTDLTDYDGVGLLFSLRALQLQVRGDDRAARENLETALALSRQLRHCVPTALATWNGAFDVNVFRGFDKCVRRIGPRPDVLKSVLELLEQHEKEIPDPLDNLKADYVVTLNHPAGALGTWGDVTLEDHLVRLALENPWERERQARFVNAVYVGQLRQSKLALEDYEMSGKTRDLALRLAAGGWTAAQWERLRSGLFGKFKWPQFKAHDYLTYLGDLRVRQVHLALILYQIEEGHAAANLNDLVPRYLSAVPLDPLGNQPFEYRVSTGEEIAGPFFVENETRKEQLRSGQGLLLSSERLLYPVPVWGKK
jgi:hypothetical protein